MTKTTHKKLIHKAVSKKILKNSQGALDSYEAYKKAAQILEICETASGKGISFKSDAGSTLNFEITGHGVYSTAQDI